MVQVTVSATLVDYTGSHVLMIFLLYFFFLFVGLYYSFVSTQGMHPAFIGAQYPFSMATGPQPPMAATAVTFPGVPVPSMTQIAVHPYHTETGLPLSTTVTGPEHILCIISYSSEMLIYLFVGWVRFKKKGKRRFQFKTTS